jgi:dipeptidyl-peptidase-3
MAFYIVFLVALCNAQTEAAPAKNPLVDRVADTGFIQLEAPSFKELTPRQQALAYWLSQAAIAIDPIIYDQVSAYGLREKRLLEEIVAHPQGLDPEAARKITDFAKLFWANRGNHNDTTTQKFLPGFTFDELKQAVLTAQKNGAFKTAYADLPAIATPEQLERELDQLKAPLFDPNVEPTTTAKNPQGGKDIIQASSNTFYPGLTLADLEGFPEHFPLNSRVERGPDGKLHENVYRAGTPDGRVPPGLYSTYLKKANEYLQKAQAVADPQQAQVIGDLVRFYQTGEFNDWLKFGQDWVKNDEPVDFANGFIEVYIDARGAKGSSQSFVSVTDRPVTRAVTKLGANAEYFEQKAPWAAQYKKKAFRPPVIKAVETVAETGDFHVNTIGDNLPNENQIREKYGSKNFIFTATTRALNDAGGHNTLEAFGASPEEIERGKKYGDEAEDLQTALHEVIGHGSGKLSPRLAGGSERYLKEYFSTLEEGRADLMALWNVWDPKLKELGLVSNQEEVAKAMCDAATLAPLTQLRRIPKGDTIEEDHQRDRALIVGYVMDKTGAIRKFNRDGKTYYQVVDYQKMRQGVGSLLAELMRIKAEGDYPAIKALVDKYAVHFDPALRDQVVARYKNLNLPAYWAGINPELTARVAATGRIAKVEINYPRDAVKQYLRYAAMYDPGLAASAQSAAEAKRRAKPSTR